MPKATNGDTSNEAANTPAGQPGPEAGAGGVDPGMGSQERREDAARATGRVPAGHVRVQLSGNWRNRVTGEEYETYDWVVLDEQTARDLDTAGYLVRDGEGGQRGITRPDQPSPEAAAS